MLISAFRDKVCTAEPNHITGTVTVKKIPSTANYCNYERTPSFSQICGRKKTKKNAEIADRD